jgi:hypothetical protein
MKKQSFILLSFLAISLVLLAYCTEPTKPLFYTEGGNYIVNDNFLIKSSEPMSANDINQLITLDTAYAKLTKGKCILLTTQRVQNILGIRNLNKFDRLDNLNRYDQVKFIVDLNRGCFESQQIDWAQFGDLKTRLDAILDKYKPARIDGNISIWANRVATEAVRLDEVSINQLYSATFSGVNEKAICGDYMGPKKLNQLIWRINKSQLEMKPELYSKLQAVLSKFNSAPVIRTVAN